MSLLTEFKQRKVFRVAAAYAVVAWLLIEVVSVVLPALRLPEWTVTFTTILLLLGFPVALVLAWSFDIVRDRGAAPPPPQSALQERCVAVLPFANMTEDSAQTHFADGLVEDILTRLQAIQWLKVVSRQSAFAYKGRSVDIRTISRELGCRYLVEGSVRKIDDRMRVTAQLIDATSDQHLWAERYDRHLTDAFELQDEICEQVFAAIQSRLAPGAADAIAAAVHPEPGALAASPAPPGRREVVARLLAVRWTIPALAALVAMAALLTWTTQQRSKERWAREEALPELQELIARDEYTGAFDLAGRIERIVPNDPQLQALQPSYAARVQLETSPPGAQAYFRPYETPDAQWRLIGETPFERALVPIGVGVWKLERPGNSTVTRVFRNPGAAELRNELVASKIAALSDVNFTLPLPDAATAPREMVLVPATNLPVALVAGPNPVDLPAFFIDRFEVSNHEFKEFVESGGYREAAFWQDLPFGDEIESWTAAVARFVDATGRPGPSTWESGTYPDGGGDHPVAGVSWFEAMAYARFRGKDLPTAFHWYRAAYALLENLDALSSAIVRFSNYSGQGPAPVGRHQGIGPFGTYDMAGNVREWLWTPIDGDRMIAGGSWTDPPYLFNQIDSALPWDRSSSNGFRCMRTLQGGLISAALRNPITTTVVDYSALRPVDDVAYEVLEAQLQYSSAGVDPRAESSPSGNPSWTRERISLATGYDESRFKVQLFLPTRGRPPFQTIVYLPHWGHFAYAQTSDEFDPAGQYQPLDFILKSGRAFAVIEFDGSFERRWSEGRRTSVSIPDRFRLRLKHHRQDLGRTLDYLATRDDIDVDRIGSLQMSYGAHAMMPLLALEERIGAAVLVAGGVFLFDELPAAEQPYNYLPRIRQPVQMLNGRWDIMFGVESQQAQMRLLGTPTDRKRHILFEAGHGYLPHNQFVRATLDWYDQHLGPTQ